MLKYLPMGLGFSAGLWQKDFSVLGQKYLRVPALTKLEGNLE